MMIDVAKLRGKLAEAKVTQAMLAARMQKSPTTIGKMVRGESDIATHEAAQIVAVCNDSKPGTFHDSDVIAIFFTPKVS